MFSLLLSPSTLPLYSVFTFPPAAFSVSACSTAAAADAARPLVDLLPVGGASLMLTCDWLLRRSLMLLADWLLVMGVTLAVDLTGLHVEDVREYSTVRKFVFTLTSTCMYIVHVNTQSCTCVEAL